jgi:hypothetical protein
MGAHVLLLLAVEISFSSKPEQQNVNILPLLGLNPATFGTQTHHSCQLDHF